jgi:rubrerythrin
MRTPTPGHRLLQLLRRAHAAERGAALVYAGHARSLRDPEQRWHVERIAAEEWAHQLRLGRMIARLGGRPSRLHELAMLLIGHLGAALCQVSGWYLPMYGAGALEAGNIQEYLDAAALADACGRPADAEDLLDMARCEREHEGYFRALARGHPASRVLPLWPAPAPAALRETSGAGAWPGHCMDELAPALAAEA